MSSKPDWVTEKSVSNKVHTFEVAANSSTAQRSGVIVFCDDKEGVCLPCNVKQKAGDPGLAGGGNENVNDGNPVTW